MMLTTWRRQKKLVGGIVDVLYSAQLNEDDDFIVFHTDDGMDGNKKIKRNQKEPKAHPQKPRRLSP